MKYLASATLGAAITYAILSVLFAPSNILRRMKKHDPQKAAGYQGFFPSKTSTTFTYPIYPDVPEENLRSYQYVQYKDRPRHWRTR